MHNGLLHDPRRDRESLLSSANEFNRNDPLAMQRYQAQQAAMAGDPRYASIGATPSRGSRILDTVRHAVPRMVGDFGKGLLHSTAAGANRIAQRLIPGEQPHMRQMSDWSSSQVPESGAGSAGGFIGNMAPEFTLAGDVADMSRVPGYLAEGELGSAGLSALAAVPFIGTPAAGLLKAGRGAKAATEVAGAAQEAQRAQGLLTTRMRTEYPATMHPELFIDPVTKKPYAGTAMERSADEQAVTKMRDEARSDIDSGNYEPYFNIGERYNVDPQNYDVSGQVARPARAATVEKYKALYDTPETRQRLREGFDAASGDPLAADWYAVGQLEEVAVDLLGPEAGRAWFDENFATAMAATTGGADPTANLLTAAYGNNVRRYGLPNAPGEMVDPLPSYLNKKGKEIEGTMFPHTSQVPHPVGGRFLAGNLNMYDNVAGSPTGIGAKQRPKRYNFRSNFLGDESRATIDEQMMGAIDPSPELKAEWGIKSPDKEWKAPEGSSYGIAEDVVAEVAREMGVAPMNFQDVVWAGLKGGSGKPMMQHINEAIERTSRVTNQTPEDVVRNWITKDAPLFAVAGLGVGVGAASQQREGG